ncbi:MAG: hypothetical protein JRM72_01610 [Nitrososphaerota archaeon]|nr:hypothetical protein [Nitrososphaerota archaeon]
MTYADLITGLNGIFKNTVPNITASLYGSGNVNIRKEIRNFIVTSSAKAAVVPRITVTMVYEKRDEETLVFHGAPHSYSSSIRVAPTFNHRHISGGELCVGAGYGMIRKMISLSNLNNAAKRLANNFEPVEAVLANTDSNDRFNSQRYHQLSSLQIPGQNIGPFKWKGTPWYHLKKPELQELENAIVQATANKKLTVNSAKDVIVAALAPQYPGMDIRGLPDWLFKHVVTRHNLTITPLKPQTVSPESVVNKTQPKVRITLNTLKDNDLFIEVKN